MKLLTLVSRMQFCGVSQALPSPLGAGAAGGASEEGSQSLPHSFPLHQLMSCKLPK